MIINAQARKYLAVFLSAVILLLIAWMIVILISGEKAPENPIEIYREASQNLKNLNDFSLIYNTEYSVISDEEISNLTSTTELLKKGNRLKAYEKGSEGAEMIYFYDQEQNLTVYCLIALYPESCQKLDSPLLVPNLNPQEYVETSKEWLEKGMLSLEYLGKKKISNRTCHEIQVNYDVEKIQEEIERLIGPDQAQGYLLSLNYIGCIDGKTGLPLQIIHSSERILFDKKFKISFTSAFSDLDLSPTISEEDLELPLPINLNLDLADIEGLGIYDPWFGKTGIGAESGKLDIATEIDFKKMEGRVYRVNIETSDCVKKLTGSLRDKILKDFDDILFEINKGIKYIGKESCAFNSSVEIIDNFISPPSYLPDKVGTYGLVDIRTSMGNGVSLFIDFYNLNPEGNQIPPEWPRSLKGYVYFWEDFKEACYKISFDNNVWALIRDNLNRINGEYCK